MVLTAEDILRQIESARCQVAGGREYIGDGQDGPLSRSAVRCGLPHHCSRSAGEASKAEAENQTVRQGADDGASKRTLRYLFRV